MSNSVEELSPSIYPILQRSRLRRPLSTLKRAGRGFAYYILNRVLLRLPFRVLRVAALRCVVKRVGVGVGLLIGCEVRNGRNIEIGDRTVVNSRVLLDGRGGRLVIGADVDIAQETNIWTMEHDVNNDSHASCGGDVIIEDHVWVASRVTILPGVRIGRGAVVATNSVVTKDVLPLTIVGGVPARQIGVRRNNLTYRLDHKPWFQ